MTEDQPEKGRWAIIALLFFFMLINFADKAIIGLAGVPIMTELNLTPKQFGLVGSSFFLLFSISAVVTGFVVNRVRSKWVLLVMGLVWSLVQFPMLGTVGIELLIACRIVLGAGEGPAYPIALHAAYKWFPDQARAVPSAIICGIAICLGGVALLAAPYAPNVAMTIALIVAGTTLPSVVYVLSPAILSEITPASQRGAVLAINSAVGTSAGIIAPYLMGSVIEGAASAAQGYSQGFTVCGGVTLIGGLIALLFLRPERERAGFALRASVKPTLGFV